MKFVDKKTKTYCEWKPDWISIGLWFVMIGGSLFIWFTIIKPIVDFIR